MERQATALIGRCYAGLDVAGLREEVLRRLRRMLSVDAAFFATVDPHDLAVHLGRRRRTAWRRNAAVPGERVRP